MFRFCITAALVQLVFPFLTATLNETTVPGGMWSMGKRSYKITWTGLGGLQGEEAHPLEAPLQTALLAMMRDTIFCWRPQAKQVLGVQWPHNLWRPT